MNLCRLIGHEIETFGKHVSLIFKDRSFFNTDMQHHANRLAHALRKLGIGFGDRIIVQMPNCPEVLWSFQAAWQVGAVVVPINFLVGEAETAFIYKDSGAQLIISSLSFWPKIDACRHVSQEIRHILLIDDDVPPGTIAFHHLLGESTENGDIADTKRDDLAALIYTSGTTGNPKGVMHTHGSLHANAVLQQETLKLPSGLTGISVLPLCHSYGIANMVLGAVIGGGRSILLDSFDIDNVFSAIETYKANIMGAVPTMYVYMLLHPQVEKYDLSSMRYWISGSSPLTLEAWTQFKKKFGFEIIEGWGLTEAGANNAVNPFEGKKKIGSVGLPMKGTHIKIVDPQGNTLPVGEEGEILIQGPMLMKGYWNQPDETAAALRGGWLHTGDIGRLDEEGYLFITDRKKDIIIKGGENISPKEIEEVVSSYPKVSECAVIGIKDVLYGEDIKAFIVLKPGEKATQEEIIVHCKKHLKRFKCPRTIEILESFPKNLVGKILKKELRKREHG